ncbi:hypothetical protein Cgig2_012318 [Carnegiea gigantea]|uniref:Uncharacterized protein n=1 Tax=Carnegiea gigantea TaxID=171969 RepID=A0A9Q1GJJ1_9CARY|nr:hypothetical protein Cgig2_012318 [Carnegiea gigantea]
MVWASERKRGFDRTEASAAAFGSAVYQAFVVIPPDLHDGSKPTSAGALVSPTAIQSTSNGKQSAPPPTPNAEPSTCGVQSSRLNSNKPLSNSKGGASNKSISEGSAREPPKDIGVQPSDILEKARAAIASAERASAAARAAAQLVNTNFASLKLEESRS